MTIKELKEVLTAFPDDMDVRVSCDRYIRKIIDVNTIIDIDTNIVSVDIMAEDKPSFN